MATKEVSRQPARRVGRRIAAGAGLLALAVVAGAVWILGLLTVERHVGYFGPAFSKDGEAVYFVERRARGIVWGFGWEFFTPPAHARAWNDSLRLRRLDLSSGAVTTLEAWDGSPIVGRTLRQYRGRVFNHLRAALRPRDDGAVEYDFELALPRVPTADVHQLHGLWAEGAQRRRGEWRGPSAGGARLSDPVIDGERELFTVPGPESFPAAIVLLDHADRTVRVLRSTPDYAERNPAGPTVASLMAVSHKADHDRVREMTRIKRERIAVYLAQGFNEGDATLRASRDLRDLGYSPKPQRWVATPVVPGQIDPDVALPRLDIAEMEFQVGLFPDLEQAMASPGTEIDKAFRRYLRHRDFDSSERLNALLEAGTSELLIARGSRVFHFRLLPAEPAKRTSGTTPN